MDGPGASAAFAFGKYLEVLNQLLPVSFTPSRIVQAMSAADRSAVAVRLLVAIVRSYVARGSGGNASDKLPPIVLVVDNGQHLDSASLTFVTALMTAIPNLLIVLATQPMANAPTPIKQPPGGDTGLPGTPSIFKSLSFSSSLAEQLGATTVIKLQGLSKLETKKVATARIGVTDCPPLLSDMLFSESNGNPYFAEQLVQTWVEAGEVSVDGRQCTYTPRAESSAAYSAKKAPNAVPKNLQQVIVERIERLPWSQQLTLKAASVVGGAFNIDVLKRVHSELRQQDNDVIHLDLTQLCQMDFLEVVNNRDPNERAPPNSAQKRRRAARLSSIATPRAPAQPKNASSPAYVENARFEGLLYDGHWDFKNSSLRTAVCSLLSETQLKAAHWEIARLLEENLMKTVERRCRRHSSFYLSSTSSSQSSLSMGNRGLEEAALAVLQASPVAVVPLQSVKIEETTHPERAHTFQLAKVRKGGVSGIFGYWDRHSHTLAADSVEEMRGWLAKCNEAASQALDEDDVVRGDRLLQGWLYQEHKGTGWKRHWFVLLPGQLLVHAKQPAQDMLPRLNHYNAFKMQDNLPNIAEHFQRSGDQRSAMKYLNYAGILAWENGAIREATECFSAASELESKLETAVEGTAVEGTEQRRAHAHLQRLMAEAYVAAGPEHTASASKALHHINKALEYLGHGIDRVPAPKTAADWHFPQSDNLFEQLAEQDILEDSAQPFQLDIVRCYALLFELTCLNTPRLFCRATDALKAAWSGVKLSFEIAHVESIVVSLANACVAALAQGHAHSASKLATDCEAYLEMTSDLRCTAHVQSSLAEYYMATCNWDAVYGYLDSAHTIFIELGDTWRAAEMVDYTAWLYHCREDYEALATESADDAEAEYMPSVRGERQQTESGSAVHYSIIRRLGIIRQAWSQLRATGSGAAHRAECRNQLEYHLPEEFISMVMEQVRQKRLHSSLLSATSLSAPSLSVDGRFFSDGGETPDRARVVVRPRLSLWGGSLRDIRALSDGAIRVRHTSDNGRDGQRKLPARGCQGAFTGLVGHRGFGTDLAPRSASPDSSRRRLDQTCQDLGKRRREAA